MIVADVHSPKSDTLIRLRACLDMFRRKSLPLLWLLHDASPRSRIQASALRAEHILEYERLGLVLPGIIERLNDGERRTAAEAMASEARDFLTGMFTDTSTLTPTQVKVGTAIVARATAVTSIDDWLQMVWRFDNVTHQHCLLVAGLAAAFSRSLGMSERDYRSLTESDRSGIGAAITSPSGPKTRGLNHDWDGSTTRRESCSK